MLLCHYVTEIQDNQQTGDEKTDHVDEAALWIQFYPNFCLIIKFMQVAYPNLDHLDVNKRLVDKFEADFKWESLSLS